MSTTNETRAQAAALGRVGVIGSGAVGGSLARALADAGATVVAVTARKKAHAEALARRIPGCRAVASLAEVVAASDLILLAAPDDAITPIAATLPWRAGSGSSISAGQWARGRSPAPPNAGRRSRRSIR